MSETSPGRSVAPRAASTAGRVLLFLVVVGWSLATTVVPVAAHAVLTAMTPEADQTLDSPPEQIRLEFSESVTATPDSIRVFDPSATELDGLDPQAAGSVVLAELPELTEDGSYTVSWKVVSADGHPIRGAYLFHLRQATLSEPVDVAAASGATGLANVFRAVGAVLALGALAVCLGSGPSRTGDRDVERWWAFRWVPVLAGTALAFGGALVSVGSGLGASFDAVLATASGRMALAALVLAAVGLAVSLAPVNPASDLPLALLTIGAIALQGHAVSQPPLVLSAIATTLHVLAAVAWAAGLLWMEHHTRCSPNDDVRRVVRRWSPWGMGLVVVLAVSGAALVLERVPLDELFDRNYGRLAVLKLVLLVVAVGLAVRNRRAAERDSAPAAALRAGLRVEIAVLAAALIAGAVLAQVPPSPSEAGSVVEDERYAERAEFGDGVVELSVEPGARGTNEVHIVALADDGRLMAEADEFTLSWELPAEDVGPITSDLQRITAGHSSAFVRIPLEGTWTATVTSRIDRFTELSAEFQVPIGP